MELDRLRKDMALRSKRGLHFILASIVLWILVLIIWLLPIKDILQKNLLTFCVTALLLPLALITSKLIKSEFSAKDNPLNNLGMLFSCNQILYILIAMWIYHTVPEKMVMVIAVIFGAHLMPFSWLYKSKAYFIMAIIISVSIWIVGMMFNPVVVSCVMIGFEIIFSVWLVMEVKHLARNN